MASPNISLLLADDHQLIRDAVGRHLSSVGFDVSMADTFESVLDRIRDNGPFNIVLLDVDMPGMHGLSSFETVIDANKEGSVVLFSGILPPEFIWQALDIGALGFIPKFMPLNSLESALRLVAIGERFVPHVIYGKGAQNDGPWAQRAQAGLSEVELSVLFGASNGQSNKEIAHDMCTTETAIKMHMRSICKKLDASNRTHAAMIAKQRQLI